MTLVVLQIAGIAFLLAVIFLSIFMITKNSRIKKKFTSSESPTMDNFEKILSSSFQKTFIKDFNGAIDDINAALQIKPHMEKLYYQRAKIKEELKDYEGAKADYTKAILLNPRYDVAYLNRGLLKIKLEEYTGARKDLNKALELNSSLSEAQFFKHEAEMKVKNIQKATDQMDIGFDDENTSQKSGSK